MTVASMTGYARAEGRDAQTSWVWEAKSVNGRGLELRCRLASGHDALEIAARDAAAKRLKRGNVQLSLTVSRVGEQSLLQVNTPLLAQLLSMCKEWEGRFPGVAPARLDGLLAIRGVLEPEVDPERGDTEETRQLREAAMKVSLDSMLDQLAAMRADEGARIAAVLNGQLDEITRLTAKAAACASLRPDAIRERFKAQLAAVLEAAPSLAEDRVAQEVALLVVKADVREELDRLSAHVEAARELLGQGGAIGRKLDFLAQEFNREANTLCSKSSDVELTRVGLDLKAVIDQFKEQVQNIE
ncbi:YicC family protein [Paramagnetospirillum kuznetsovii]|uniref:YicC family protein n=1 Tax=Paramagnetospirillum kuznetsovii TaxID=2053833 RepID=A0A364NW75_9PROT|nr:YicC/YloC family endoribonuclease [Paramagnetospirillum kuznetsovii]RAU21328.1 YicC family protein [Paramagnetospirillum kuznetsovii]